MKNKGIGIQIAKQPSKGAPRSMEDSRSLPKEATRSPYSNPSEGKEGIGKCPNME